MHRPDLSSASNDGEQLARVELQAASQDGQVTLTGEAVVALS
jgi:hypothetical protein